MAHTDTKLNPALPMREDYLGAAQRHLEDSKYLFCGERFESAHEHAHFCLENIIKHCVGFDRAQHNIRKGHDLLYLADLRFSHSGRMVSLAELLLASPVEKAKFEVIDSAWSVHCRYFRKYLSLADRAHIEKYWELFEWIKMEFRV